MSFLAQTGLDRFNPAQGGVRGMKVIATGLLVAMAVVFIIARRFEDVHPALGYVRAFAEAAMVGGLADWFAVTALFRHPLGLPIPHTAIIPRNKDRIGDNLANFLKSNFLTPSIVARRLERVDIAGAAGRWLASPPTDGRLRRSAVALITQTLDALDHDKIGGMVRQASAARLRSLEVAPLIGQALSAMIDQSRHVPILDALIAKAGAILAANEDMIRNMVHERAGWIMRLAGIDEKLSTTIIDGLYKLFGDMADDPGHPIRLKIEQGLASLAQDLQHDAETRARVERIKVEIIDNPAVSQWLEGLWQSARSGLLRSLAAPGATMGRFGEAMGELGRTLEGDAALRAAINQFARRAVVGAVADYGGSVVRLVSDTIHGWDAQTVTDRLEAAVGRDLQYIRINGTLVGGLVGVTIHFIASFF